MLKKPTRVSRQNSLTIVAKNITSQLLFIEEANQLHAFLKRQHFQKQQQISKKNQATAKPHPEDELLLFEDYLLSSYTVSSSQNSKRYSEKR